MKKRRKAQIWLPEEINYTYKELQDIIIQAWEKGKIEQIVQETKGAFTEEIGGLYTHINEAFAEIQTSKKPSNTDTEALFDKLDKRIDGIERLQKDKKEDPEWVTRKQLNRVRNDLHWVMNRLEYADIAMGIPDTRPYKPE